MSGGLAYFTVPGTAGQSVTPYVDRDATASHALDGGGVRLDAGGRAQVYLASPATVRVEDSTGATVDTFEDPASTAALVEVRNAGFTGVDPTSGALVAGGRTYMDAVLTSLAASAGGPDGKFLQATGAVARNVQSVIGEIQVSVKSFGAVGNGTTDDTAAIQAAINYISGLGGGTVYFPPGTYLISAALTVGGSSIAFVGPGYAATIKQSNLSANGFTTAGSNYIFRGLSMTTTGTSTGTAISSAGSAVFDTLTIGSFATSIATGASGFFITNCALAGSASTPAVSIGTLGYVVIVGGDINGLSGSSAISIATAATAWLNGVYLNRAGSGIGVDMVGTSSLYATGVRNDGAGVGLRTAATTGVVLDRGCNWGTAGVTDGRTGAPVNYVFAGANNMTPLPLQAEVIRVEQQTGGVVTTINNITAIGFTKTFVLICSNTSGGASTFTFGANYVLSAAVTPGAGNRVALYLYYDPRTSKTYETGRAATAN